VFSSASFPELLILMCVLRFDGFPPSNRLLTIFLAYRSDALVNLFKELVINRVCNVQANLDKRQTETITMFVQDFFEPKK
jgi:hypothetical protein